LQHTTRVAALLHVVDATTDVTASTAMILEELGQYAHELAHKPRLLVINKIDLLTSAELKALKKKHPKAIFTSVSQPSGLEDLRQAIVGLMLDKK
jgi:GTPase involved in cell partitioning and DNA repair